MEGGSRGRGGSRQSGRVSRRGRDRRPQREGRKAEEVFNSLTMLVIEVKDFEQMVMHLTADTVTCSLASLYVAVDNLLPNFKCHSVDPLPEGAMWVVTGLDGEPPQEQFMCHSADPLPEGAMWVTTGLEGEPPQEQFKCHSADPLPEGAMWVVTGLEGEPPQEQGVVLGVEHPTLRFVGHLGVQASKLQATCPSGCVHVSSSVKEVHRDSSMLVHTEGNDETSYLVKMGKWKENLSLMPGLFEEYADTHFSGAVKSSALRLRPLQLALIKLVLADANWLALLIDSLSRAARADAFGAEIEIAGQSVETVTNEKVVVSQQLDEMSLKAERLQEEVDELQLMVDQRADEQSQTDANMMNWSAELTAQQARIDQLTSLLASSEEERVVMQRTSDQLAVAYNELEGQTLVMEKGLSRFSLQVTHLACENDNLAASVAHDDLQRRIQLRQTRLSIRLQSIPRRAESSSSLATMAANNLNAPVAPSALLQGRAELDRMGLNSPHRHLGGQRSTSGLSLGSSTQPRRAVAQMDASSPPPRYTRPKLPPGSLHTTQAGSGTDGRKQSTASLHTAQAFPGLLHTTQAGSGTDGRKQSTASLHTAQAGLSTPAQAGSGTDGRKLSTASLHTVQAFPGLLHTTQAGSGTDGRKQSTASLHTAQAGSECMQFAAPSASPGLIHPAQAGSGTDGRKQSTASLHTAQAPPGLLHTTQAGSGTDGRKQSTASLHTAQAGLSTRPRRAVAQMDASSPLPRYTRSRLPPGLSTRPRRAVAPMDTSSSLPCYTQPRRVVNARCSLPHLYGPSARCYSAIGPMAGGDVREYGCDIAQLSSELAETFQRLAFSESGARPQALSTLSIDQVMDKIARPQVSSTLSIDQVMDEIGHAELTNLLKSSLITPSRLPSIGDKELERAGVLNPDTRLLLQLTGKALKRAGMA
eukprot:gene11402-12105_t